MPPDQVKNPDDNQWSLLLVYDFYRVLSVLLFLSIYFYNDTPRINSSIFFREFNG